MKERYISESAPSILIEYLRNKGYNLNIVRASSDINSPISSHADIRFCRLGLRDSDMVIESMPGELASDYPLDVPFNACCTGRFFIHSLDASSPRLLAAAEKLGMISIDVRQGYARCSTIPVDESSIITYDRGIAKACIAAGLDVLTVEPGHVLLPGYDTGFIGGTTGVFEDEIVFAGDLSRHPDFLSIRSFIEDRGRRVVFFDDFPLTDIGSII